MSDRPAKPWPEGLFVPCKEISGREEELSDNEPWKPVVLRSVQRLFGLDLEAVEIGGALDDMGRGYQILLWSEEHGGVFLDAWVKNPTFGGRVHVHAREGRGIRAAIRETGILAFEAWWMSRAGYAHGYPAGTLIELDSETDTLSLSTGPAWR